MPRYDVTFRRTTKEYLSVVLDAPDLATAVKQAKKEIEDSDDWCDGKVGKARLHQLRRLHD